MIVITVSRQLGCGGREIGRRVAEKLGIAYLDHEIITRAAGLAGVSEEILADVDERRPTLLDFMADLLARYPTASELGMPAVDIEPPVGQDAYRSLFEDVIRDVANKGSAVIVGRGGQMILRDNPRAMHMHVIAPFDLRVKRVMEREGLSRADAEKRVHDSDRNRAGYLKTYYKMDWQNPELYALMINTGRLDMDTAVDLVVGAARSLLGDS